MASLDLLLDFSRFHSAINHLPQLLCSSPPPSNTADVIAVLLVVTSSLGYFSHGRLWDKPDPHHHIYFERPQVKGDATSGRITLTRDVSQRLLEGNYHCVIFWGSQSGTSERFAETLGQECRSHFGLNALVADLSDFDADSIAKIQNTHFVVFILSTYGEGDPSDNTAGLWDWIKKVKNESTRLESLRYLAFGLGNSNYKYYNRVIDAVADALDAAGATALMPREKADDANGGTEEDFQTWKDNVFALYRRLGYEEKDVVYQPTMEISFSGDSATDQPLSSITSRTHQLSSTISEIVPLTITNAYDLFTSGDRNCVHLELDLSNQDVVYKTGDHIGIWPSNPDNEIDLLLAALGVQSRRRECVNIESLQKPKVPTPTTLETLFRHHLEICAPVPRKTVLEVSQFAPTPEARSMLLSLGQDRTRYAQFASRTHVTFARLLTLASPEKPWTLLPIAFVIENLLSLQPRYYSISSSSVISPRRMAITALVVNKKHEDETASAIFGLTSNYLLSASGIASRFGMPTPTYARNIGNPGLQSGKIFAHVRKSKFKLPITSSTPLILIGAGTGLAPFRAFLQERAKLHAIGKPIGQILLFFGCRNQADFIYQEEISKIQASLGKKLTVITAFSREDQGIQRVYVQDRVGEYAARILDLLDSGANLYVCGKSSMAREVDMKLEAAAIKMKNLGDSDAKSWMDSLKKRGKWKADVWG